MEKLLIILFLILITPIFSTAEEENILGYKKSETIYLDDYLYYNSGQKTYYYSLFAALIHSSTRIKSLLVYLGYLLL